MRHRLLQTLQILAWLIVLWFPAVTFAHDADSSYCRIRLFPDRLEARVTYDVFTLQKIAPDIDANRDNALSKAELEAATSTIQTFIEANVLLELNGNPAELGTPNTPMWPLDGPDPLPRDRWHDDTALILFRFDQPLKTLPSHVRLNITTFPTVGAAHRVLAVLEEGATPQPIILSTNRPAHTFSTSAAGSVSADSKSAHEVAEQPSSASQFFVEGIKHILEGYDHICFLLALLVAARRLGQVALIVTAFTVAHSITLILAARGIIALPARAIECAIAATIIYVAVENLFRTEPKFRWGLTFVFGLIHGFGFANVLGELTLPPDALVASLLLFNVGVEAGQLAIVMVVWPLIVLLHRAAWGRKVTNTINVLVAVLGLAWLVDRMFELELMPF